MEAENLGEDRGEGRRERFMTPRNSAFGIGILLAIGSVPLPSPFSLAAQDTTKGKAVYVKWCAGCHGDGGAGDGPAAASMLPRPRNFTSGLYKIRTTASGQLPTDADQIGRAHV